MTFKNITHLKILQKYRSQHLSFLKGDGPKFKGMLRRQDMIFVDIIIIGDEGNSDDLSCAKNHLSCNIH